LKGAAERAWQSCIKDGRKGKREEKKEWQQVITHVLVAIMKEESNSLNAKRETNMKQSNPLHGQNQRRR